MSGQHTPGPWLREGYRVGTYLPRGENKDLYWETVAELEHKRDGALIAAAPDLLDALTLFEAFYPMGINLDLDEAARKARAAIAKATGVK